MNEYVVTISFAGYVGSDNDYTQFGNNEEEAEELALDDARDDLNVTDIVNTEDDEWEVTVSFAGYIGVEETYTVYADDEEDAEQAAIEEAFWDLNVERVVEA